MSSVDPRAEIAAVKGRLDALTDGKTYIGVEQGTVLDVDAWGKKAPYRDFEPGSIIQSATQRQLVASEQDQPHIWSFQVHHTAPTRQAAVDLSIATDMALIGWAPSENATVITPFFFTMYDEFNENGERVSWTASRFYKTTLGMAV